MNITSKHIFWTGFGILLIYNLIIYLKIYRRKYVMMILFIIGLISSLIGLALFSYPEFEMEKGHAATTFFAPIIYISIYQILRMIFKKQTGIEPAYEFASTYDSKDKRRLSIFDYIVYIIPFVLSLVIPLIIG